MALDYDETQWNQDIKNKLNTTKHMLMFDPLISSSQQKLLLYSILNSPSNGTVEEWFSYVRYLAEKDENFNSICRLFNFAFTFLDQPSNYQNQTFIDICLYKAEYFGKHGKDPRKVFREMEKKKIGTFCAEFYKSWSSFERKYDEALADLIINKGIKRGAQPQEILIALQSEKKRKHGVQFDDGEVVIEKKSRRANSTEIQNIVETLEKDQASVVPEIGTKVAALTKATLSQNSGSQTRLGRASRINTSQEKNEIEIDMPEKRSRGNTNRLSNISDSSGQSLQSHSSNGSGKTQPEEKKSLKVLKEKYIDDRLANFDPKRRISRDKEVMESKQSETPQPIPKDEDKDLSSSSADGETRQETKLEDNGLTVKENIPPNNTEKKRRISFSKNDDQRIPGTIDEEVDISKKLRVVKREQKDSQFFTAFKEIYVNNRPYLQLDGVLGKGASSSVCRVISLGSQNENSADISHSSGVNIFAYKRIEIKNTLPEDTEEVFASYANEINLLKQCRGCPYIINLLDYEVNRRDMFVSMVLELGEVDLANAINYYKKATSSTENSSKVNPYFMRMVWERMLLAVDYIHEHRIVHGDLKPANFVFVKGQLKLIDFGISKEISNDTTNIVRSGLIGTLNYMAPEAVMPQTIPVHEGSDDEDENEKKSKQISPQQFIKHGRASDVWSLGCILYQMLYGKTPFATIRNIQQKVALITNPNAEIQYPSISEHHGVDVAKKCLVREISKRATIRGENGLLRHPFLTSHTNTICDQSTNTDPFSVAIFSPQRQTKNQETQCDKQIVNHQNQNHGHTHHVSGITRVETRRIVQSVLDHLQNTQQGTLEKEELCEQIFQSLHPPDQTPPLHSLPSIDEENSDCNEEDDSQSKHQQTLPSSLFKSIQTRKPLRKLPPQPLPPPPSSNTSAGTSATKVSKNKDNIPPSALQLHPHDIATAKSNLKQALTSTSSKWMKEKPQSNSMQDVLSRQLGNMRQFMIPEDDMTNGSTFDHDEFSLDF